MLDKSPVETLLEVNNIEVIYNHVILVLKGVSLTVPKGGITALLGGNGAHIRSLLETQKCLLELIHARIGKKQCRIIGRHQGARFNPGMTLGLKITEESFANVGRFHG